MASCESKGSMLLTSSSNGSKFQDQFLQALTICASKPFVQSVCWHDLADPPGLATNTATQCPEMPFGGLIGPNGAPKSALARLAQARSAIKDGRSPLAR